MKGIIYQTRRFTRFEVESLLEKDKFERISEEEFDNMVTKYRDQYELKYIEGGQEFIDKDTGWRFRRFYR